MKREPTTGKRFWEVISRGYLRHLYYDLKLSQQQIAGIIGCTSRTPIENAMKCYMFQRRKNGGGKGLNASIRWVGDAVSRPAAHHRLYKMFGKPRRCDHCHTTTAKCYDWANLSGNYADPNDFKRLCRSCHLKLDYSMGLRSNGR